MSKCSLCGNEYDKPFTILKDGQSRVFDSFECAIQALAPTCAHCNCRIIGHGVEADGTFYCCAHCAASAGHPEIHDRSDGTDRPAQRTKSNIAKRRAKSVEAKVPIHGGGLKHMLKTGLPPGIEPEQFWDPGSQTLRKRMPA